LSASSAARSPKTARSAGLSLRRRRGCWANLGRRILLAQVKDARPDPARADGWQLVLLGEGEVPVRDMLALLSAGGYRGWVSVEWEKRWHPEIAEPELALPQHLTVLNTWIRELNERPERT
jgi:sugar phosphate isomerase/epimerase